MLPGNPASVILGRNATPAAERVLTQRMQLDRPATTRYFDWLGGFVHGDLGISAVSLAQGQHASVWQPDLGAAQELGHPGGDRGALHDPALDRARRDRRRSSRASPIDHVISLFSLAAIALPEFVTGSLLIGVFFVGARLAAAGRARPARR